MSQSRLENYGSRYRHIKMERREGILQLTLHTDGGEFKWGAQPLEDLSYAFADIARDRENRCVIITGTGSVFCAEMDTRGGPGGIRVPAQNAGDPPPEPAGIPPPVWDNIFTHAKRMHTHLLDIEVPIIAAVNGPALIRADIAVLSDIVLAAENAEFQDAPHFANSVVPGDGVHILWPLLLGPNRGRYFLLTGQRIPAQQALALGIVAEVLPSNKLLPRAWELARQITAKPTLTVRYARVAMTQRLRTLMLENLGYGLALEGLAAGAVWPGAAR